MVVNGHPARPESLGLHYGFSRNPYDPSPLAPAPGDSSLFVGRAGEGLALRTFIGSFERGGLVVEGGTGVGKTSFVNVQEYRAGGPANARSLLSTHQPIQLASTLNPTEFLLSVLSNVLSSLEAAHPKVARDRAFRRLSLAVSQTIQQSRGWEVSAAGFGAGLSSDVSVSSPLLVLLPAVGRQLDEAAQLASEYGIRRLVVNVNNLDVVAPQSLVTFLDIARDLTLTRSPYLWVFLGPVGTRALIAAKTRRVSELLRSDPIWLPPLTLEEIHEAIQARIRRFRNSPSVEPPIEQEVIRTLYESSAGEVRYILNRCTDLLLKTMAEFPTSRTISRELALPMLQRMTLEAVGRLNLTRKQRALLGRLARSAPCQPKEFRSYGFASAPAFLRYLSRFYELGLVDRRRRDAAVVYTPRGDVVLALGQPAGSATVR